jgi:hypothetical protein
MEEKSGELTGAAVGGLMWARLLAPSPVCTATLAGTMPPGGLSSFKSLHGAVCLGRVTVPVVVAKPKSRSPRTKKPAEPIRITSGEGLIETVEARGKGWTAPGLADLIGISKGAVYAAVRAGKLPKIEGTGTSVRICPKAAGQWLRDPKTVLEGEPLAAKHRQGKRSRTG